MSATVTFRGGKELEQALKNLGKVADKVGRAAVRKASVELHAEVLARVPVRQGSTVRRRKNKDGSITVADYGHLRDNLKVRLAPRRYRRAYAIEYEINVGNAFWGRFLEYGTRKSAAQPFFRPVWDSKKEASLVTISDMLWKGIARENKKLGLPAPSGVD